MSHQSIALPKGTNKWVSLAGFGMVLLAGIGMLPATVPGWVLPSLGAFVGIFGVKDAKAFLLAGLALYAAQMGLGFVPTIGAYASQTAHALVTFIAPAMLIVSARCIYDQIKK